MADVFMVSVAIKIARSQIVRSLEGHSSKVTAAGGGLEGVGEAPDVAAAFHAAMENALRGGPAELVRAIEAAGLPIKRDSGDSGLKLV